MNTTVLAATIVAIGIVAGVLVHAYFSPYHSCMRDLDARATSSYGGGVPTLCAGSGR